MIQSLAYIGFTSPNFAAWPGFAASVLGLEVAQPGPDGAIRLRVDDAVQRIVVHPGERDDVAYLGWSVAGPAELGDAVDRVQQHGFKVERGDPALTQLRAVADLVWFHDSFGFRHEIAWGLMTRPSSFRPGRAMSGFVTGEGGLGHVVLVVPDPDRGERFLVDVLGFKLSDRIDMGLSVRFFHCNPRHHTVALGAGPGVVGLHHLMLEVRSLDDVGTALDICTTRELPIVMGLGRHTNDLMTSFYVRSPSGFEIEYGWGGRLVDDAKWEVRSYDAMSVWGHRRPDSAPVPGMIRPFGA